MNYRLSCPDIATKLIKVSFDTTIPEKGELTFSLPSWRPGRYELGNFARNILHFKAEIVSNPNLNPPPHLGRLGGVEKGHRNSWIIKGNPGEVSQISYSYFANRLDAGSCFVSEDLFYINPVHLLMYIPGTENDSCELQINIPDNFIVNTALPQISKNLFSAKSFHQLVDSPVIASPNLQEYYFSSGPDAGDTSDKDEVNFKISIYGKHNLSENTILSDFEDFSEKQMELFGGIPLNGDSSGKREYHFLFIFTEEKFHHGVEHCNSTVIALGPGLELNDGAGYDELLSISSHELFHTWNVKSIRPVEMMPYDYSKENYSKLTAVAEGATTYYGDLILLRSGVFNETQYFTAFNKYIQKHFENPGRFNLSLADSAFDMWVDGYGEAVPGRRVSIYTEGCLNTWHLDRMIREATSNNYSFDHVMRTMYERFGRKAIGYSETDYKNIIEEIAGKSFDDYFQNYFYGVKNDESLIKETADYFGCELVIEGTNYLIKKMDTPSMFQKNNFADWVDGNC